MSWKRLLLLLLFCVVITLYLLFDPSRVGWFPRCPFRTLTGWQCPGCGSQRAFHSLLHGDIGAAWIYNPALVIGLPFILLLLVSEMWRTKSPRFYYYLHHPILLITLIIIIFAWWIGRNLLPAMV